MTYRLQLLISFNKLFSVMSCKKLSLTHSRQRLEFASARILHITKHKYEHKLQSKQAIIFLITMLLEKANFSLDNIPISMKQQSIKKVIRAITCNKL